MADIDILRTAIFALVTFLVVALIAVAILAHIIATGMYAAEREELAEAGEPVGDWPHVVSWGPMPDAARERRFRAMLADARARHRGENLDGTPRRETNSDPAEAAPHPSPRPLAGEGQGEGATATGKHPMSVVRESLTTAADGQGPSLREARWPAADAPGRWTV